MYLITGATGNVGRPLVDHLLSADAKVRAVTRDAAAAGLPADAEVVQADLAAPADLGEILAGVNAIFLNPAAVGQDIAPLLKAAVDHGVGRVVLLSSGAIRDGAADQSDPLAAWHLGLESAVRASGLGFTFVRPFEFAANVLQQWGGQIRYTSAVHEPYPAATSAVIHERDIAAVAATALLSADHDGHVYPITGPAALTRVEMVEILSAALGRPIEFREIPPEAAVASMVDNGLPEPIASSVVAMRQMSVTHPAPVTDVVEQLIGSPALSFAEWAADHRADF